MTLLVEEPKQAKPAWAPAAKRGGDAARSVRGRRRRAVRRILWGAGLVMLTTLLVSVLAPRWTMQKLTAVEHRVCRWVGSAAPSASAPAILAHRGYVAHATMAENSVASVEAALGAGYPGVEVDVIFTKDQVPVLFHDPWLFRLTGQSGYVHELTWAELREMPLRDGQRILSLEEFWTTYAGRFSSLCIDLKGDEEHALERARALSDAMPPLESMPRTLVVGHPLPVLRELARMRQDLHYACERYGVLANKLCGFNAVSASRAMYSPGQARLARALGMTYMLWVVNDDAALRSARTTGVDVILTDRLPADAFALSPAATH